MKEEAFTRPPSQHEYRNPFFKRKTTNVFTGVSRSFSDVLPTHFRSRAISTNLYADGAQATKKPRINSVRSGPVTRKLVNSQIHTVQKKRLPVLRFTVVDRLPSRIFSEHVLNIAHFDSNGNNLVLEHCLDDFSLLTA